MGGGGNVRAARTLFTRELSDQAKKKIGSGVGQMCQKDTPPPSGYRLFKIILGKCASKHGKHTEIFFPTFFSSFSGVGARETPQTAMVLRYYRAQWGMFSRVMHGWC